jgi:GrpB-like predicted nucleotidyltransferase (UPF0157 family)
MDADPVIEEHRRRLRSLLGDADVLLTGSASITGLDAVDLDLVVLVEDVGAAAARVAAEYAPLHPEQWRDDWAAFREPGPPQVDVVLTRAGSVGDAHHRRAWELLAAEPVLVGEYAELKATPGDYEARKAAFFVRIVALLDEEPLA